MLPDLLYFPTSRRLQHLYLSAYGASSCAFGTRGPRPSRNLRGLCTDHCPPLGELTMLPDPLVSPFPSLWTPSTSRSQRPRPYGDYSSCAFGTPGDQHPRNLWRLCSVHWSVSVCQSHTGDPVQYQRSVNVSIWYTATTWDTFKTWSHFEAKRSKVKLMSCTQAKTQSARPVTRKQMSIIYLRLPRAW